MVAVVVVVVEQQVGKPGQEELVGLHIHRLDQERPLVLLVEIHRTPEQGQLVVLLVELLLANHNYLALAWLEGQLEHSFVEEARLQPLGLRDEHDFLHRDLRQNVEYSLTQFDLPRCRGLLYPRLWILVGLGLGWGLKSPVRRQPAHLQIGHTPVG